MNSRAGSATTPTSRTTSTSPAATPPSSWWGSAPSSAARATAPPDRKPASILHSQRGPMSAALETFNRRESAIRSYCRSFPIVFERAQGAELIAADGRRYLDFLAGRSTRHQNGREPGRERVCQYV